MAGALLLLGVLVAIGLLLSGAVIWLMAVSLLRPPRMTDGKAAWVLRRLSPGDLGLNFEDLTFDVPDARSGGKLRVAAWWIPKADPAPEGRCAVLVHGYADAKVGAIAWAPTWHALGFNVLAIDLRAHGQSGGRDCTAGFFERHDTNAVIDLIRAERPSQAREFVLFGVSLGAAVASAAAAQRDDLSAVVLESPFADFGSAAISHMDRMGLPGPPFPRATVALAQRISGADFSAVRPVDTIRKLRAPVMVIVPTDDPFLSPPDVAALEASTRAHPQNLWWHVAQAGHATTLSAGPDKYRQRLEEFLRMALSRSPQRSDVAAV